MEEEEKNKILKQEKTELISLLKRMGVSDEEIERIFHSK